MIPADGFTPYKSSIESGKIIPDLGQAFLQNVDITLSRFDSDAGRYNKDVYKKKRLDAALKEHKGKFNEAADCLTPMGNTSENVAREFAVMLAFDVKVDKEAEELANQLGIKIFSAEIIYHLFDAFTAHNKEITEQKRADQAPKAVFPCVLKMIPGAIFNKRSPIVMGVDVIEGALRVGTPICIAPFNTETQQREVVFLGNVAGIEQNHKPIEICKKGQAGGGIAIKLELPPYESPKIYGRHFTDKDELYSKISRSSIDILKESFRNDVSKEEWGLIIKLKKVLNID
jgi:translation initiation factor 5B